MKTSRYTPEQVIYALKQAEAGEPVTDLCRKMGVSEATFYNRRRRHSSLDYLSPADFLKRHFQKQNQRLN